MFKKQKKLVSSMMHTLDTQVEQIRQMSLSEIKNLPEYSDREVHAYGKVFTLATWKKERPEEMVSVVAQVYYRGILGIGTMWADGYLIDKNGEFKPLPDEIRWEYC